MKKPKHQFRIEGDNRIPLGIVDCAGITDKEPHQTYGPLDGRLVYCYKCATNRVKIAL